MKELHKIAEQEAKKEAELQQMFTYLKLKITNSSLSVDEVTEAKKLLESMIKNKGSETAASKYPKEKEKNLEELAEFGESQPEHEDHVDKH